MVGMAGAQVTGVVLAGGKGSRMAGEQAHKALLDVGGRSIVGRVIDSLAMVLDDVVIVANDPVPFARFGVRVVPDRADLSGMSGPMTGVVSGLTDAGRDCFVAACDMPFIEPKLVAFLVGLREGYDLVVPTTGGRPEPLFGVYRMAALPALERALKGGTRSLQEVFASLSVRYVDEEELRAHDPELLSFINVNTPQDLARAREILLARDAVEGRRLL